MRKLTSALVILLLGATAFAQSSRYEDLEYFDKVILKGNVKKVSLENGDREIVVDGADKNSVKLSRLAGIITLEITSSGPVAVSITNGSLKWIEASSETEIEGAEYLSGGKGKYLVVGMKDSKGRSNNENFNFNFDDFDFDFDYDFDSDFDFDFDFDYDFDFNFDRDYSYNYDYNYDYKYDYKYDRKVNRVKEKNDN